MHRDQPLSLAAAKWGGAVFLLTATTAFWFGAARGLDLTDESYYLLHYLYITEVTISTTFFGFYLSWPFHALHESIAAIRIFGFGLLCGSAAYFISRLYRYFDYHTNVNTPGLVPELIAGIGCALIYYAPFGTNRVPSYNLVVLVCILLSSGILFDITSRPQSAGKLKVKLVLYGFTLSLCLFSKAPAAAATVICHLAFLLLAVPAIAAPLVRVMLTWATLGGLLNLLLITAYVPNWYEIAVAAATPSKQSNGYDSHLLSQSLTDLRWYLQGITERGWKAAFVIMAGYLIAVRLALRKAPQIIPYLVIAIISGLSFTIAVTPAAYAPWIPFQIMAIWFLWSIEFLARTPLRFNRGDAISAGLITLLFALAISYSLGTNMLLVWHSKMAAIFPLAGCLLVLYRLRLTGILRTTAYYACLTVLCVPALWNQIGSWVDLSHTYRLNGPLSEQDTRLVFGPRDSSIRLDPRAYDEVTGLNTILSASGFAYGDPILDFTGVNPGLVFLAGGRPLGAIWLFINSQSENAIGAKDTLDPVAAEQLRHTWTIFPAKTNPNYSPRCARCSSPAFRNCVSTYSAKS